MKPLRLMLCVVLLLMAACSTGEVEVTRGVKTAVFTTATATLTPSTNTPTPPTALPTFTPTLEPSPTSAPLPTATPLPEPSATAVPVTQGTLYFVWQPDPKPAPEDMGPGEVPAKKLYRVIPGTTPNQWVLESVLSDIRCFCQPKLSPDKTNLAFIQTEDANQDGGFYDDDKHTIYTYNFAENRLTRLEHFDFSQKYSWLSDSQSILYRHQYNANWGIAKIGESTPGTLLQNNMQIPRLIIENLSNSPDGHTQIVAIVYDSGGLQLALFDTVQLAVNSIFDATGFDLDIIWSPDNDWLAATLNFGTGGLYVANAKTLEAIQVVKSEDLIERVYPPAWSFQGEWLAFVQDKTILWSWHQPTALVKQLASKNFVGSPVWSPHEDVVAVSFTTDEAGGILLVNPAEQSLAELTLDSVPIGSPIWTPDGQWLLFPARQNETTGYYLIHRQGGDVYPVFDTTGLYEPTDFFWLDD